MLIAALVNLALAVYGILVARGQITWRSEPGRSMRPILAFWGFTPDADGNAQFNRRSGALLAVVCGIAAAITFGVLLTRLVR